MTRLILVLLCGLGTLCAADEAPKAEAILDRYLEVTFKIRAGWRWTDGTPVTAQDALFAWQTIMSPESNLRDPLTQKVYAMSAPDAHTIVVSFMSAAQARAAAGALLTGDVAFEYFSQLGDYAQYAQQESAVADAQYWAVLRWLPGFEKNFTASSNVREISASAVLSTA